MFEEKKLDSKFLRNKIVVYIVIAMVTLVTLSIIATALIQQYREEKKAEKECLK